MWNSEIFSIDDDLFVKTKKNKLKKINCDICGKYPKQDFILVKVTFKRRLLTYQHNNLEDY